MVSTDVARAKVNLTLKVVGRRPDGYHDLESLVTFAAVGDRLTLSPGEPAGVVVEGPFATAIDGINLLAVAIELLAAADPALRLGRVGLEKTLPVAAGLGGGSADAGALLRLLRQANGARATAPLWADVARRLGADVPVCFGGRPAVLRGTGAEFEPLPVTSDTLPPLPAVLVNPGLPLPTARVFSALAAATGSGARPPPPQLPFPSWPRLIDYIAAVGNDLEPPAVGLAPVIAEVKAALAAAPGCRVAQMSGSGPTCFGLFEDAARAAAAADALRQARTQWWIVATALAGVARAP